MICGVTKSSRHRPLTKRQADTLAETTKAIASTAANIRGG